MTRVFDSNADVLSETISGDYWIEDQNSEIKYNFSDTKLSDGRTLVIEDSAECASIETAGSDDFTFYSTIEVADIGYSTIEERIQILLDAGVDPSIVSTIEANYYNAGATDIPVLYNSFQVALSEMNENETVDISIILSEQPEFALSRVDLGMESTLPGISLDASADRITQIEDRILDLEDLQQPLVDYITSNGGTVSAQHWAINTIRAQVPVWLITELSNRSDVAKIHGESDPEPAGVYYDELREVTQTEFFRDHGGLVFQGMRGSGRNESSRIYVAVMDCGTFNENHCSFQDDTSNSRVYSTWNCCSSTYTPCNVGLNTNADPANDHATRMAAIIGQDVMDGQDTYWASDLQHSAVASEVYFAFINCGGCGLSCVGDYITSIETAIYLNVDILSSSMVMDGGGYDCDTLPGIQREEQNCPSEAVSRGTDSTSQTVNSAFDDGILFVHAAGNNRNWGDDPFWADDEYCQCSNRTLGPGNASNAFTVGAYEANDDDPNSNFWATGELKAYSNDGPTMDGRIKPDITAPTNIMCYPNADPSLDDCGEYGYVCDTGDTSSGTSSAQPVVAGSAAIFKDWYIYLAGATKANYPGKLFVNLLNFGDRRDPTAPFSNYYDEYWGAGRLRMRLPIQAAMDSPWRWSTGMITMDDGDNYQKWMGVKSNPTDPISTDVDYLKLAFWWPEPNTDIGETKADISVAVCKVDTVPICKTHVSNGDQKIHFIYDSVDSNADDFEGGYPYFFYISADQIPDGETRTIYWTWFWEDLARDDPSPDGPCYSCGNTDPKFLLYK
jgi:hypothetical protein